MIPVTKPYIPDINKYMRWVSKANESEWLTNFGPLHEELTLRLEEYLKVSNLLLVSNGTLALQVAYKALKLTNSVISTPFSFAATSSALLSEKITPKYYDIDINTLNLDVSGIPEYLDKNISGIQAVHVFGNPANVDALERCSSVNKVKLIFDGAHAFGVNLNNRSILSYGDASTLSFHATKIFHTVEGGGIIFKKREDFEFAKSLINFGFDSSKYPVSVGTNAKLSEYHAAVGLVIVDEIDDIISKRVDIMDRYTKKLRDFVEFPEWTEGSNRNGAYFPILLKDELQLLGLMSILKENKIESRRYFYPSLNTVPVLRDEVISCPNSENISSRILCLPMYTSLSLDEQNKVINSTLKFFMGSEYI